MKKIWMAFMLVCTLALTSCAAHKPTPQSADQAAETVTHLTVKKSAASDKGIEDDADLYDYDPLDVVCFYATVTVGNAADGTNHTLEEVNSYLNLQGMENVEKIYTQALLQVGDEEGPRSGEVGYSALGANATMNVRGRTSTGYPQKSYRFTLYDNAGLWRGQRAIALNKHPADLTRLRNMLYFQLLRDVPGIPSLRTQFVRLYVKDLTADPPADSFVDYGLFTQVELPNNRYLRNHELSIDGNLYKAQMCEMFRYPEKLKLATDLDYDPAAFATVLEPKTNEDHRKLLEMLDAVNDYGTPIEEIVEKYFDLDNLTSYMAFNLLMGNEDSNAQNYLLYSPVNSDKWYYLCWDGDGCLHYGQDDLMEDSFEVSSWNYGVSDYWGVVLFNRLLRTDAFRAALDEKMTLLRELITPERVNELVARYREVVDPFTARLPDSVNMRATIAQRDAVCLTLGQDVARSYQYYLDSLEKPMPFHLGDAEIGDGTLNLSWDAAYDFAGEFVRYDVQLAKDWEFKEPLFEAKGILETRVFCELPDPGEYFWRVTATNERGQTQVAFDSIVTGTGAHHGMRHFILQEDGGVVNPE